MYRNAALSANCDRIHPSGVRTEIPIPLSSHMKAIGTSIPWNAFQHAELIAPWAVE